uniref:site-specific integrase n=2 Tax=Gelidibacter sp. TaxID=2018083 RepID=UPI00404B5E36
MQTLDTFGIIFILKLEKQRQGAAPIYARITVNGKRAFISVKRKINITDWNQSAGKGKGNSPKIRQLNSYLDQVYGQLLDAHKQLLAEHKIISSQTLKNRYLGTDETFKKLTDLLNYHNVNMVNILKAGTMKNYYTTEKYLKEFVQSVMKCEDIYLKQINYRFITDFEHFLRTYKPKTYRLAPTNNGVMKHLERLKKLLNLAQKLEWVEKDPFAKFSLKFDKVEREFLNEQELEDILNYTSTRNALMQTRDIFVFACYTGLSWIDVKNLNTNHIVCGIDGEKWIYTFREKTDTPVKIPILGKAQELLDKYAEKMQESTSLLPVYSNQKTNHYLKAIALGLGIRKKLTFHVARHTFATTVTLSNGVPIETVSKLLGHTKLSTTQIYARVVERKVSNDMNNLKAILSKKDALLKNDRAI